MNKPEKRIINFDLNDTHYEVEYEISNDHDGWFDLSIWYKGNPLKRECLATL